MAGRPRPGAQFVAQLPVSPKPEAEAIWSLRFCLHRIALQRLLPHNQSTELFNFSPDLYFDSGFLFTSSPISPANNFSPGVSKRARSGPKLYRPDSREYTQKVSEGKLSSGGGGLYYRAN